MLHKIKLPDGIKRLERIIEFQRKLLVFACHPDTPISPVEQDISNAFADEGEWLWRKVKPADSKLRKLMESVIRYCHRYPKMGKQIVEAFDHDVEFHRRIDDAAFQFSYVRLSKAAKKAVRPLMEAFYDNILTATGFPECVHGEPHHFDRRKLVDAFMTSNESLRVCPACDGPRATSLGDEVQADADHFLPKSKYPFLSVHPFNLVPLCLDCNRSIKKDRKPIDDERREPLLNVFHPYLRPARDQIEVRIENTSVGTMQVRIEDRLGHPSRRVRSLNHVLRLEERWPAPLKVIKDRINELILTERRRLARQGKQPDDKELRLNLTDYLESAEERIERDYWYILHSSYLKYALANDAEFDDLLGTFLS